MDDLSDLLTGSVAGTGTSMQKIRTAIRKQRDVEGGPATDLETADELAFSFRESDDPETEPYFESARLLKDPEANRITANTIEHWRRRADISSNPVLRARYADLAWEFAGDAGMRRDPASARGAIDAYAEAVRTRGYAYQHDAIRAVRRAFHLARLLRDENRRSAIAALSIEYERAIAEDSLIGLWGFSFDLLVANAGTSDPELINSLVADLEQRLARLTAPTVAAVDARAVEAAALRLAAHYRSRKESDNAARVLRLLRTAYETAASEENPLVAYAWLERVHSILVSYGLRADAEQLAIVLRGYAERGRDAMSEISVEVPVPPDKLEEFLKAVFAGSVDEALTRIAARYVPLRSDLEKDLREQADSHPLQYIFPRAIKDAEGRTAAHVGPIHSDMEGHIVHLMSQQMTYVAYFLRKIVERMPRASIDAEVLTTFMFRSWLFEEERLDLVRRGVHDVLAGDYPAAIHILVPQIEHLVRRAAEGAGLSTYRPAAHGGGLSLKLLDTLLREETLAQALSADVLLYLRVLLTDQRGWNVRNTVCHGMMTPSSMGPLVADRLLHALLLLATLTGSASGSDSS